MKKNVFKLFIALFLVALFTTTVNASLVCNPDDEEVTITETGITPAGFDVLLPVCKWTKTGNYKVEGGTYSTYDDAFDSGYETERITVESYDGKDIMHLEVPRCSDPDRYVSAKVTCTKTTTASYHSYDTTNTCPDKSESECTGGCTWDADTETCGGSNSRTVVYYECPNGYTPTGHVDRGTTCTYSKEYSYSKIGATDDVITTARESFGDDGTCVAEYTLNCPTYTCERYYKNIEACTPDFEIDGQPAYCVNPSQKFNGGVGNYQYDDSFNVYDCASSYSTVDCGYANILIEGAYYNTSDDAINTALRLWSIHSGQAGDERTGIANVSGSDCKTITYYTTDENDEYVNVYKHTHDYIMYVAKEKFYDVAKTYAHIPPEENGNTMGVLNGSTFEKIACLTTEELRNQNSAKVKTMRGVMCGDDSDYLVGFELFFNTVIGNEYMKNHLSRLFGGGDGSKPTGATLQSEFSMEEATAQTVTESWIEVSFEHESFWNEIHDEQVGCTDSELGALRTKLINEGKTASEADAVIAQIKPYCKVKVQVVDEDGNILVTEKEMEKCIKGSGCRTEKFNFAICDITESAGKDIEIKVTYERTRSSYSVRKYYSCANANINQTLFAFFKDETETEEGHEEGEPVEVDRQETETTFSVTNYKCAGGCDDTSLRTEGDDKCVNDQNNYNGVYSATVKDPSLKCILNLNESAAKTRYDYSSYFGVNTNFCRVYCSDEVEYTLADKVKAISGKTFMYDIEFPAKKTNKLDYKLTSIVAEKRNCVSEIYYTHLGNLEELKTAYGLTSEEYTELKKTKTFDGLFNILKTKASGENERNDNLNQIIYDIYNCNFYTTEQIKNAGVDIPRNYTTSLMKKVKEVYSSNNAYGLGTDKEGNKTTSSNADTIKYGFGALIKDVTGTNNRVNNISAASKFTGKLSGISYCKDKTGELCYGYDPNNDALSYNYPANKPAAKKTYTLFRGKNIDVPTNDYARFTVTAEINYYNNDKFQADMGTGKVVRGTGNANLLTLASFSYPVDKDAYNLDACRTSLSGGLYHRCTVTQTIKPLMFYRNDTTQKLTINDDNTFKCYVDVQKPNCDDPTKTSCEDKSAALYRNVDPANLFPSGNTKEGSNWNTANGQKAKEAIENSASDLKTDEKYLDASITLDPTQIRNIKEYNNSNGGYSDELIYNCEKDPVDGIYYNCNSYFLDVLRGNASQYRSGQYGNVNTDNMN